MRLESFMCHRAQGPLVSAYGLDSSQQERYARHIQLKQVGVKGQKRLLSSRVLCVGAGGLGSAALTHLAASGVGHIAVADGDVVDITNLQRQPIHAGRVGMNKALSAAAFIGVLNPEVVVEPIAHHISPLEVAQLVGRFDAVLDCSDNFPTRYMLNDACVLAKVPLFHASVQRFEGLAMSILPKSACYRCVFAHMPPSGAVPSSSEAGIMGVVPALLGVVQATECIKHLLGLERSLAGVLMHYDAMRMRFEHMEVMRDAGCPVCGDHPTITSIIPEMYEYR